jgi:hypothetical protein
MVLHEKLTVTHLVNSDLSMNQKFHFCRHAFTASVSFSHSKILQHIILDCTRCMSFF